MGKIKDTVDKFLGKIDHTEERYELALEKKQEELIELQQQLQDASEKFKEFQKMHVLGDISDGALKEAGVDVEALTDKIASLQEQISLIDHYKREDIETVLAEIEAVKPELNAERNKEVTRIQYEVQQARLAYVQALVKARKDFWKVANTNSKIGDVMVKLGLKTYNHVGGAYESIGFPSARVGDTSFATLNPFIDQHTAHEALHFGKIPSQLINNVEEGKKAGYIK